MEMIPEAFAPKLRLHESAQERHECADDKKGYEAKLFLRLALLKPGRDNGDNQIKADERIHKPEDATHGSEIPGYGLQVSHALFPIHGAPEQRYQGVCHQEEDEGRQDVQEPTLIERTHGLTGLHRHQQISRYHHKQRHTATGYSSIPECHPEAVALIGKHGGTASQARRIRCIEILTCMYKHHQ